MVLPNLIRRKKNFNGCFHGICVRIFTHEKIKFDKVGELTDKSDNRKAFGNMSKAFRLIIQLMYRCPKSRLRTNMPVVQDHRKSQKPLYLS